MGYSKSPLAIKRVQTLLDQMVLATSDLTWPAENAHMLGYYIRQAMTIAKKQKLEPYHMLKDRFVIRNRGNKVTAELRDISPASGLQSVMSQIRLEEVNSLMEIIGALITHNTADQFHFPKANLTDEELTQLYKWSRENEKFMVVSDSEGITIVSTDPGDVKWTP